MVLARPTSFVITLIAFLKGDVRPVSDSSRDEMGLVSERHSGCRLSAETASTLVNWAVLVDTTLFAVDRVLGFTKQNVVFRETTRWQAPLRVTKLNFCNWTCLRCALQKASIRRPGHKRNS